MRFHAGRNDHRQDDIAALLARGVAHDPADRLHHVHLRIARGQEQDGIQGWYVDTLGQAAHIAQDAAGVVVGIGLEPSELGLFLTGIHTAVYMVGFACQRRGRIVVLGCLVGLDHRLKHTGDVLGADLVCFRTLAHLDDLAEGHGALHGLVVAVQFRGQPLFG